MDFHARNAAMMPLRKIASKVPAPPTDATGAPALARFLRFMTSAPMRVPIVPLMYATATAVNGSPPASTMPQISAHNGGIRNHVAIPSPAIGFEVLKTTAATTAVPIRQRR